MLTGLAGCSEEPKNACMPQVEKVAIENTEAFVAEVNSIARNSFSNTKSGGKADFINQIANNLSGKYPALSQQLRCSRSSYLDQSDQWEIQKAWLDRGYYFNANVFTPDTWTGQEPLLMPGKIANKPLAEYKPLKGIFDEGDIEDALEDAKVIEIDVPSISAAGFVIPRQNWPVLNQAKIQEAAQLMGIPEKKVYESVLMHEASHVILNNKGYKETKNHEFIAGAAGMITGGDIEITFLLSGLLESARNDWGELVVSQNKNNYEKSQALILELLKRRMSGQAAIERIKSYFSDGRPGTREHRAAIAIDILKKIPESDRAALQADYIHEARQLVDEVL